MTYCLFDYNGVNYITQRTCMSIMTGRDDPTESNRIKALLRKVFNRNNHIIILTTEIVENFMGILGIDHSLNFAPRRNSIKMIKFDFLMSDVNYNKYFINIEYTVYEIDLNRYLLEDNTNSIHKRINKIEKTMRNMKRRLEEIEIQVNVFNKLLKK